MINLRSVDLNLLPIFEAVYEERNMTRAADRLAMTQPAVSNAVSRLRTALRDDLFVAGRRGTAVTPLAEAVYPRVKSALDGVRDALGETRQFSPKTSDRRFAAGLIYAPGAAFGRVLAEWMRREAPKVGWRFAQFNDREDALAALREGRLDFVLDHAAPATGDLRGTLLFHDELVVVASNTHPRLGRTLTRKEFLSERHAVHRSLRTPGSVVQIEGALGDRTLDVAVEVREAIELPITVAGTDYIAVCNRRLAEPWLTLLKLKLLPLPFRTPPVRGYLLWHASRERDAGHAWMRQGMVRLAAASR